MSIKRKVVETVVETCVCDINGHDLGDYGWAVVRRKDGKELAHFQHLTDLLHPQLAEKLFEAAWAASHDATDDEEVDD